MKEEKMRPSDSEVPDEGNWVKVEEALTNVPTEAVDELPWKSNSKYLNDSSALTLIFTRGTGFHKEQWEPTIDDFYALLETDDKSPKVREVWLIDAPNHAEAAVLNEDVLKIGYEPIFPWEEYARAIYTFLTNFGTGVDVDFNTRRLVGIGHSMTRNGMLW